MNPTCYGNTNTSKHYYIRYVRFYHTIKIKTVL